MATKDNKTTNDIKTERSFIEIIRDIDYRLTHLEDMEADNRKLIAKLVKQGNTVVEFLKGKILLENLKRNSKNIGIK